MFINGNLQLVGGAPRREVLRVAWDALDGEDVPVENTQASRKPLSLFKVSSTPVLTEDDVSSQQRSLLNCILSLSKLLAENAGNKLSPKQIDYAQTIYAAGTQLLSFVDRQVLDDLTGGAQMAFSQVTPTYHGPRSRRSDDGLVEVESDAAVSSGGRRSVPELAGKKVLIVDDDILNIYAMTSVLEQQGMIIMHADNGLSGLKMLRAHDDTDAVIVNSGMQALGNHELIGAIRGIPSLKLMPIIAVTSDNGVDEQGRGKCVEIGASDFIDKPINTEQLLSLMRAWLTQG